MELKLEQFIKNVEVITNIHNRNKMPMMFRMPKEGTTLGLLFFCSYQVPRYVVLPENAIWIDLDPESSTYRTAFKRIKKDNLDPYKDVWNPLYFYEDALEDQTYDPADLGLVSVELPPLATSFSNGIGYLSYPQRESKVITNADSSLTNARPPKPHTHPEKPASRLAMTNTTFVAIEDQMQPQINQVLVFGANTVEWRKIKEDELK